MIRVLCQFYELGEDEDETYWGYFDSASGKIFRGLDGKCMGTVKNVHTMTPIPSWWPDYQDTYKVDAK